MRGRGGGGGHPGSFELGFHIESGNIGDLNTNVVSFIGRSIQISIMCGAHRSIRALSSREPQSAAAASALSTPTWRGSSIYFGPITPLY